MKCRWQENVTAGSAGYWGVLARGHACMHTCEFSSTGYLTQEREERGIGGRVNGLVGKDTKEEGGREDTLCSISDVWVRSCWLQCPENKKRSGSGLLGEFHVWRCCWRRGVGSRRGMGGRREVRLMGKEGVGGMLQSCGRWDARLIISASWRL